MLAQAGTGASKKAPRKRGFLVHGAGEIRGASLSDIGWNAFSVRVGDLRHIEVREQEDHELLDAIASDLWQSLPSETQTMPGDARYKQLQHAQSLEP